VDTHAFTSQPLAIFDANIYYPERLTLAYSENLIGTALFAAPLLWLTHMALGESWAPGRRAAPRRGCAPPGP